MARTLSRVSAALVALGWLAFWGGFLFLLWRPAYRTAFSLGGLSVNGDATATGVARLVATLVGLAAIVLGLLALGAAVPERRRRRERHAEPSAFGPVEERMPVATGTADMQHTAYPSHVAAQDTQGHMAAPAETLPRIRAEIPPDRAEERIRPLMASREPAPQSLAGTGDTDMVALRERLDRQEEELRQLRELMAHAAAGPLPPHADARNRVTNGKV